MEIIKTTLDKIEKSRTDYLNSLPEFQELYIELMIVDSNCYKLIEDDIEIGHAIVNPEDVLIEFHVADRYVPGSFDLFNQVIDELSIANVFCKSFDFLLLNHCLQSQLPYSIIGVLYRNFFEPYIPTNTDLLMKQADESSVKIILEQDDSLIELYETETLLRHFIKNEKVFLVYKNEVLVGCGMVLRTNREWDYCDLGIWVNPNHRKKGLGTQILLQLRKYAIENNMIPSCGCAVENIPSQKTIEKSGFVSKHKLINFMVVKEL